MNSQSLLLWDVKGSCHVDEGGKAVKVVTVGMRKNGVCLKRRRTEVQSMIFSALIFTWSAVTGQSSTFAYYHV